jgi:hypothetical protein
MNAILRARLAKRPVAEFGGLSHAIVSSSDLADFRLHQCPRFIAGVLTPIAVKIGAPQSFAKAL